MGLLCVSLSFTLHAQTCPGKQWDTSPPTVSGWNASKLSELHALLKTLNTTALVVVHRGKVVYEYGRTTSSYNIHSSRKSIMSMLYGIAVAKGQASMTATVGDLGIDDNGGLSEIEKTASARGHLGQYLVVVPGDDLVIAHLTDGDTKTKREVSSGDFGKIVKATLTARPAANARTDQQME